MDADSRQPPAPWALKFVSKWCVCFGMLAAVADILAAFDLVPGSHGLAFIYIAVGLIGLKVDSL